MARGFQGLQRSDTIATGRTGFEQNQRRSPQIIETNKWHQGRSSGTYVYLRHLDSLKHPVRTLRVFRHSLILLATTLIALIPQIQCQGLQTGYLIPQRQGRTITYNLTVTQAFGNPSCGEPRPIILINGLFQPTLTARVNDTIQIHLTNALPTSLPQTSQGISIHFHGMSMWDAAVWADGTAYLSQCPLRPGNTWSYSFLADEAPGTYFWHDHSSMNRANGLQGALVLSLPEEDPPIAVPTTADGDYVLFVTDWFEHEANMMAMRMNRPMDPAKMTNDTGMYMGSSNPSALLINGKGNQNDCNLTNLQPGASSRYVPVCDVSQLVTQPSLENPGCSHDVFFVQSGKTYNFRLINGGTQQFLTVCFEKHVVTLAAADTTPMDFPEITTGCVDLNSGQRYDVYLTADQPPGLYWISVHTQYMSGAPSAYAVLQYVDAPPGTAGSTGLPLTPTPQPAGVAPWDLDTQSLIATSDFILGYNDNYDYERYFSLFRHRGAYDTGILFYDLVPDKVVVLNMTSPVMPNGAIKWAMNNVAMPTNPPCAAVMESLRDNPQLLSLNVAPDTEAGREAATMSALSAQVYSSKDKFSAYDGQDIPKLPAVGLHMIDLPMNAVVDIIIQNLGAGDMAGDHYYSNPAAHRNFSMQHPMHLHGHKFWVLGVGPGIYDPAVNEYDLNFRAPILRDTATVPPYSWMYLRFKANNPGIWPLHCHIMWHSFMGQQIYFATALDKVPPRPVPGPTCPEECVNNFAPYKVSWVKENLNNSRYETP